MDEWKTSCRGSSQIPAFGNWDYVNDLPITQYFECARQAGLIRYSSSSGECDPHSAADSTDLYAVADYSHKPPPRSKQMQGKGREKRGGMTQAGNYNYNHNYTYNNKQEANMNVNSRKQGAGKVFNVTVTELPPPSSAGGGKRRHAVKQQQHQQQFQRDAGSAAPDQAQAPAQPRRPPKAVDEDLYKIPPELLKRKRRLGFISRCLVPPCAV
uniref:RIN4 pathogenic type III effector avirulence factor Avr cleavage site domain-containing protein n=1 Tax=Opuntia streptacantha TaxID=393608 RepID=A0A7C9DBY5_OPUST